MAKIKPRNVIAWISLVLGLLVVFGTHISILAMGIPQDMLGGHAVLNLVAGGLIVLYAVLKGN